MVRKLFLFLLLAPFSLKAQTPPEAPIQHFVISVDAAGYGGSKGTTAVMLSGAAFQVTTNVSAGYFQISNPTDSTAPKYHMGSLQNTHELNALLPTSLKSKLVFDTTNWLVTFQAGAGKVNYLNVSHVAEVGGIFLSRPMSNHMQLNCGYQILHGQGTSILTRNTAGTLLVGLTSTF